MTGEANNSAAPKTPKGFENSVKIVSGVVMPKSQEEALYLAALSTIKEAGKGDTIVISKNRNSISHLVTEQRTNAGKSRESVFLTEFENGGLAAGLQSIEGGVTTTLVGLSTGQVYRAETKGSARKLVDITGPAAKAGITAEDIRTFQKISANSGEVEAGEADRIITMMNKARNLTGRVVN